MLYQLSYFRKNRPYQSYPFPHTASRRRRACNSNRHSFLWEVMDSNHRRRTPADLQSAPFGHSGNFPCFAPLPRGIRFARLSRRNWLVSLGCPRSTSPIPLWGGFRPAAARRRKKPSFLRNSQPQNSSSFQTSLTVKLFFGCCHRQGLFSSSSRRLSEPMEGFEPTTC